MNPPGNNPENTPENNPEKTPGKALDGSAGHRRPRAVVLVRERPATHPAEDDAHLVPLPLRSADGQRDVLGALCGKPLRIDHLETVRPGQGRWCTPCFVTHVTGGPPATPCAPPPDPATRSITGMGVTGTEVDTVAGRLLVGVAYQRLGWPVRLHSHEVSLDLDRDVDAVGFIMPAVLASEVAEILARRRCPPPVLVHPAVPDHRVIVAGERFSVPLGWPTGVYRFTGTLPLPPTVTAYGPVCWVRPPRPDALRLCREVDVVAALRTALNAPSPAPDTADS